MGRIFLEGRSSTFVLHAFGLGVECVWVWFESWEGDPAVVESEGGELVVAQIYLTGDGCGWGSGP